MLKWILPICFLAQAAQALEVKELGPQTDLPKALDLSAKTSASQLSPLAQLKWYHKRTEWKLCLEKGGSLLDSSQLGVWVPHTYLSCLRSYYRANRKNKKESLVPYWQTFAKSGVDRILHSPFAGHRDLLLDVFLEVAYLSMDLDRDGFERMIQDQSRLSDWMSPKQRAKYYRLLGEAAWLRQKNDLAIGNFLRSYQLDPHNRVLARLKELKADGFLKLDKYSSDPLWTEAEEKLWKQWSSAYSRGETLRIAVLGADFLKQHPGSANVTKVRDGVSRFFKKVLYLRGDKFTALKADFEKNLLRAPPEYVLFWANDAAQRGYQDATYRLAKMAVEAWGETGPAADALLMAGRAAYYLAERSEAQKLFELLIDKHGGHPASAEARYLLGLLHYREGRDQQVVQLYEKFLTSRDSDRWELQVRYWLWRSLKRMNSKRAGQIAATILKDFPLTYYGLIVRMDERQDLQSLWTDQSAKSPGFQLWWTDHVDERFKRIQALLSEGWIDEAELEILFLPDPQSALGFLYRAKLYLSAGLYSRALLDYSEAVHRDFALMNPTTLKEAFPQLYSEFVASSAGEFNVNRYLVWAIMRQESAFMPRAVSPSRANGLMQMLIPTARETARWLKIKNFNPQRDIFDPALNIRFGTHFLGRMVGKYQGVIPLAIASYNVGPGNLDRWLSHRKDLTEWPKIGASLDDDIWMDELPWAETSFYVKAVMRNFLLYQVIHDQVKTLASPPWAEPRSVVEPEQKTTPEEA